MRKISGERLPVTTGNPILHLLGKITREYDIGHIQQHRAG